jgi:hypothetical protein
VKDSLSGLAVALMTALVLLAFSGYQVTGETAGPRLLGRLAASLVELDRWVPTHRDDIQLVARDRPDENVLIDDMPVDVLVPSAAVLAAGDRDQDLSGLLRDAMGRSLYTEGRSVLRDDQGVTHLGVTEPVRWTVTLLSAHTHGTWRLALIATTLVTLLLASSFILSRRSPLPYLLAGAGLAIVVSFLAWLLARSAGSLVASSVDKEILLILRDGAWLGLRDSLAVGAILLALLFLWRSLFASRIYDGRTYWPEPIDIQEDPYSSDPA